MATRKCLLGAAVALAAWLAAGIAPAQISNWNHAGGGDWTDTTKWAPDPIPNGIGAEARFVQDTPDGSYFDITNVGGTVGSLLLADTASTGFKRYGWRLYGSSLDMDAADGDNALIHFGKNRHMVYVPITLHDDLDVVYAAIGGGTSNMISVISSAPGKTTDVHINRYNPSGTGSYGSVFFNRSNTFNGDVTVHNGRLYLDSVSQCVPQTSNVTVAPGASLYVLYNFTESINGLFGSGNVVGYGYRDIDHTTLEVGADDGDGDFSGVIVESPGIATYTLSLTKLGDGTQTLRGVNTYRGTTTVAGGTLKLSGAGSINDSPLIDVQAGAILDVTDIGGLQLTSGQTLKGNGTVDGGLTLLDGSTHAPGDSPGIQTVIGDYDLQLGATLEMELQGLVAGAGYDQVNVVGAVKLAGTLDLDVGFAPDVGSSFTLIDNDDSDAVDGTFAGLPDGTTITGSYGGTDYTLLLSYFGGDGNDVVLSSVPEPGTLCLALLAALGLLTRRRRWCRLSPRLFDRVLQPPASPGDGANSPLQP